MAAKKSHIDHLITLVILFGSIGVILGVLGMGKSADPLEGEAGISAASELRPPTLADFGGQQAVELPVLMKDYLYTPGLAVTMYERVDLDAAFVEDLPGEGVFYLTRHIRQGRRWVYEVVVQKYGREYTMYFPEESLTYAGFYEAAPAADVLEAHETKRARVHASILQGEVNRQAAYEAALIKYQEAELRLNAGLFGAVGFGRVMAGVVTAVLLMMGVVFLALLWRSRVAGKSEEFSLDMDSPSEHKVPKRGADYYDPEEDDLADRRF